MPDPSFVFAQSLSGLTAAMFLFIVASGLSLIFGVLRVLNFAHGSFYMLGAYMAWQLVQWLGAAHGQLLARGARRGARGRAARRRDRAAAAAPSLRPRGALPAAVHLRAGADPRRCRARCSGARSSSAVPRPPSLAGGFERLRHRRPALQPVHHRCSGRRSRSACWLLLQPHRHRPHDPRRRLRPRDARRARRRRRQALHADVHGRLVPRRPRRRAGHAGAQHRARHGRRDHRRGVHRRGDRRPRLVLGHVPRRARSSARCSPSASSSSRASRSSPCSP